MMKGFAKPFNFVHVPLLFPSLHPETKFVGHDGKPCDSLTRGVLRRSHIVANVHRYVGKETSRRWEQGDDMSMVDFRCTEYGDGKVVPTKKQ
ncbi:MAG TPA: hypothetical protein VNX87_28535 [Candidatus Sulfotelmatobacter sp.]|jgi:hypothetical protein|nr:hypothetical protein [Candidatus Sulfotelmatobacter sp.]